MSSQPRGWSSIDNDAQTQYPVEDGFLQHQHASQTSASPLVHAYDGSRAPVHSLSSNNSSFSHVNSQNMLGSGLEKNSQGLHERQDLINGYNLSDGQQLSAQDAMQPLHKIQSSSAHSGGFPNSQQLHDNRIAQTVHANDANTPVAASITGSQESSSSRPPKAPKPRQMSAGGFTVPRQIRARGGEPKPSWTEQKTKAGKERKRLPLACIACRRKKIRCSGEKPTCRHCHRARVPCVYKVSHKKAAPKTDYMAMLDRRLKRMEERVIKIIPKDEAAEPNSIIRAVVKPLAAQSIAGKKRDAQEAFGSHLDDWAKTKAPTSLQTGRKTDEGSIYSDGAEFLPPPEIQEHLSEVFFDYIYGQSYHLMHKPTFMRRLRAGSHPPVLLLAVCALSARFSKHPKVTGEPPFLRGEEWAAPARAIAMKRYDKPNVTILIVFMLLGLHDFGTCQGGRSWMLSGMAIRMAYALQLHRELDHDPLRQNSDQSSELSFTDREIRRRALWAAFLMDRFTSSGTERPMFADEEAVKIQLPIRESDFQIGITASSASTEYLDGSLPKQSLHDRKGPSKATTHMGVAAYMVRVIALWGRVTKYLNMGGKEKDPFAIWEPESRFSALKEQVSQFTSQLPLHLQNTKENLRSHAAEKLGNQFIFLHVAANHVIIFLHRYAIPTMPGATNVSGMPKQFLMEAGPAAVQAATNISLLLDDALDYNAVAPFIGYCAFLSGTVHVWGMFSKNTSWEMTCKRSLDSNIKYLSKMEEYWGMVSLLVKNLKDIYRECSEAATGKVGDKTSMSAVVFQYGDWFGQYPYGFSKEDLTKASTKIKEELVEESPKSPKFTSVHGESDTQPISPPSTKTQLPKKVAKKKPRPMIDQPLPQISQTSQNYIESSQPQQQPHPIQNDPQQQPNQLAYPPHQQQLNVLPLSLAESIQPPMTPYTPTHPQFNQMYSSPATPHIPNMPPFPGGVGQDMLPLNTSANTSFLPQLDRSLVYGAYADTNNSTDMQALVNQMQEYSAGPNADMNGMWDGINSMGQNLPQQPQHHQQAVMMNQMDSLGPVGGYMGDLQTSAWFMPFNMNPPGLDGNGEGMGQMP